MFLGALDIAVNVALPAIADDLDADLQSVQWVIIAFVATGAGLVLGAGSFADRFGLRQVYILGAAAYLASMVAIALSPNLSMVVGFRVLQAVGTGCLFAVSPAIAASVFPAHRRGLGMGFTTASQALGMLAATVGAGLLVNWLDWEAVFWGRVPFAALALLLGLRYLPRSDRTGPGPAFDVSGAVTLIAASLCLLIGLRLGRSLGWNSQVVLVLLSLAPVLFILFWRAERRAQWPVLPLDLLRVRGFVVSVSGVFLAHLGVFVIWFIFPFYVADSLGKGAVTLGLLLAVMAFLNMALSGIGGWLCDKAGTLPVGMAGLTVLAGGLFYMGFLDGGSTLGMVALGVGIVGTGLGLFQAAAYSLMLGSVPSQRFGTASAALTLARAFGTVLSVAIIWGIFALSEDHHLAGLVQEGLSPGEADAEAFVRAIQDMFWLGALIALAGAVVFLFSGRGPASSRVFGPGIPGVPP